MVDRAGCQPKEGSDVVGAPKKVIGERNVVVHCGPQYAFENTAKLDFVWRSNRSIGSNYFADKSYSYLREFGYKLKVGRLSGGFKSNSPSNAV